jgi:protein disulfide-isomerase A6
MPDWAEASKKLHGEGVLLGVVDATVETTLAQQYGVKGYPTIKVFPGGPKTSSSAQDYQGGRSTAQIVQYALAEVDRTGIPKEIPELTSQELLQEKCSGANKLCVLVALPHILDSGASGRNKYRETLAQVAKSFRGTPFDFLWFEGGNAQTELESALEFTFGYPAVAAMSLEKMVFAVQRGSFNEKAIGKFLNSIINGRQGTLPMQSSPKIKTTQPWDGMDASPVEDEPLDDIMGEDWGEL